MKCHCWPPDGFSISSCILERERCGIRVGALVPVDGSWSRIPRLLMEAKLRRLIGAAGSSISTKVSKAQQQARHHLDPAASLNGRAQSGAALGQERASAWDAPAPAAAQIGDVQGSSGAMPNPKAPHPDDAGVLRVALDGSGHFRSVQAAIDAIPLPNSKRVVITVAPGVYRQPVYVPKQKNRITLQAQDAHKTILTWANTATSIQHAQSPQLIGTGTFACGSVIVEGEDFIAQNITFENAAPQGSGQAVAIRVTADRCAFYQCRFLGWQDTAYLHYGRHYLRDCYIEGSVDFIFGNAQALLEHCHIHCKSAGFITAQSCKSPDEPTGFVFLRCVITGTGNPTPYMHLGRPWQPCARVVFAFTFMDRCIAPAGWHNWNDPGKERTACFCEFRCSGPGSALGTRVPWMRKLTEDDAAKFLSVDFVDPQRTWLSRQPHNAPDIPVPLSA